MDGNDSYISRGLSLIRRTCPVRWIPIILWTVGFRLKEGLGENFFRASWNETETRTSDLQEAVQRRPAASFQTGNTSTPRQEVGASEYQMDTTSEDRIPHEEEDAV